MYIGPRTMPVAARKATMVFAWYAPTSARNSPTKPEVPGSATEVRVNTMKTKA